MGVCSDSRNKRKVKQDINSINSAHEDNISCIIELKSGKTVTGSYDETIKVWDINSLKCERTIIDEGEILCLLEFEENKILAGNKNNNIQLWDINDSKYSLRKNTFKGHSSLINCLVKCNDKLFASASNDKCIKIWNYSNKECIKTLQGHNDNVLSLALLKNGKLCSGSADHTIKIWNLKNFKCEKTLEKHKDSVKCVFQLSNGYIISGSEDNTIIIWYIYEELLCELNEHKGGISGICQISNDIFASSSFDKTIKIWDTKTMKCIKTIKSESNNLKEAFPVIYHSSGKLIYSNIYTFKVWEYNIENNIENKVTNEKIYLTFKTSKGHITKINTDYGKSLNEVISEYLTQMGQSGLFDSNKFKFMFSGRYLNIHSTEKIEDFIKKNNNNTIITVFDSNNLLKPS